jgi:hypothetical protein
MGNTFLTPTLVARDAAIAGAERLIVGNLVTRDKEGLFTADKVGDEIQVTVPPAITDASEFSGSTSASDMTETKVGLKLEKHFYKRIDLTSKQRTLELSDFTRLVTVPAVTGIMSSVDKFILRNMQVFRAYRSGTISNRPSTIAHIAGATKALNDRFIGRVGRIALIDTTVEESFSQLTQFQSQDYGPDAVAGLRDGTLGRRYGFGFVTDPNSGAFSRSAAANDIAGTVLVDGTVAAGGTTLHIDGITSTTGTIYAGCVFTIAGDSTRYVVRKDATIASNEVDLEIYPALAAQATDEAAITFEAAGYSNLVYHPRAVCAAVVAPAPLDGMQSAVQSFNGVSLRVTMDGSITSLASSIVYDVYVGCRVIQPEGGAAFCG